MYKIVKKEAFNTKKVEKTVKALYILYKQNLISNILLTIAAILFFTIVYFVILHTTYMSSPAVAGKTLTGQNLYNVNVLEKSPSLENVYDFKFALQQKEEVTVYTATPTEIMIYDFSGDTGFADVEAKDDGSYSPVYGLQINQAAEKINGIEVDTGRFFEAKEFKNFDGKGELPIILGSSYFNLYDVGEKLKIKVDGQEINAKVIGFLKSNQQLVTVALAQLSAAHQVVIPAQNYDALPAETNEFAKNSLQRSVNSMLVTTASKIDIRDIMLEVSKESDFWNFSIGNAGGITVNIYNSIIKANTAVILFVFLVGLIAISVLFLKQRSKRDERNRPLFRILTNSGMYHKQIEKYVLIEMLCILGVGVILPIIPFLIISQLSLTSLAMYIVASLVISMLFMFVVKRKIVIEAE